MTQLLQVVRSGVFVCFALHLLGCTTLISAKPVEMMRGLNREFKNDYGHYDAATSSLETTTTLATSSVSSTTTTTNAPVSSNTETTSSHLPLVENEKPKTLSTTTTIGFEERKEIGIYMNVGDFVLTDREFDQVLERLRREAEAMNLASPDDYEPHPFDLEKRPKPISEQGDSDDKNVQSDESIDSSCPICLDRLELGLLLKCGHIFHTDCLNEWKVRRSGAKCPICRKIMEPQARVSYHIDVKVNVESAESKEKSEELSQAQKENSRSEAN